jgi:hypothetical protein
LAFNQRASSLQGNPRRTAWISLDSFGRIVSFQSVTTTKIKKLAAAELTYEVVRDTGSRHAYPQPDRLLKDFIIEKIIL